MVQIKMCVLIIVPRFNMCVVKKLQVQFPFTERSICKDWCGINTHNERYYSQPLEGANGCVIKVSILLSSMNLTPFV